MQTHIQLTNTTYKICSVLKPADILASVINRSTTSSIHIDKGLIRSEKWFSSIDKRSIHINKDSIRSEKQLSNIDKSSISINKDSIRSEKQFSNIDKRTIHINKGLIRSEIASNKHVCSKSWHASNKANSQQVSHRSPIVIINPK